MISPDLQNAFESVFESVAIHTLVTEAHV